MSGLSAAAAANIAVLNGELRTSVDSLVQSRDPKRRFTDLSKVAQNESFAMKLSEKLSFDILDWIKVKFYTSVYPYICCCSGGNPEKEVADIVARVITPLIEHLNSQGPAPARNAQPMLPAVAVVARAASVSPAPSAAAPTPAAEPRAVQVRASEGRPARDIPSSTPDERAQRRQRAKERRARRDAAGVLATPVPPSLTAAQKQAQNCDFRTPVKLVFVNRATGEQEVFPGTTFGDLESNMRRCYKVKLYSNTLVEIDGVRIELDQNPRLKLARELVDERAQASHAVAANSRSQSSNGAGTFVVASLAAAAARKRAGQPN